LNLTATESRDQKVEKLRAKYAPKQAGKQEQIRKAQQRVEKEKSQATQQTMSAAVSFGSSILGALFGRKLASSANIGRAATSMRAAGRVARERADIAHAQESTEALQQRLADLEEQFKAEAEKVQQTTSADSVAVEEVEIKPRKADISVGKITLVWTPWRVAADGTAREAY
jgi:hypothetical protein